jgi:membrane associated rhomboid family serine protease
VNNTPPIETGSTFPGLATVIILLLTSAVTVSAFFRPRLKDRLMFDPRAILAEKQFERMLTSGLIHADWRHLLFNAFSFFSFAMAIETMFGWATLLLIYCASIIGGSLLSLVIHRHHEYRALGASGGVCGVIFAYIFLLPGCPIVFFLLPVPIPALAYAVVFLVVSFVAHRRQSDNIGHDAHLGGAIIGLLTAAAMFPKMIFAAPGTFAVVLGVSLVILALLVLDPMHLMFRRDGVSASTDNGERSRRYRENSDRNRKLAEVDDLLEKVSRGGIENLSAGQRKKLEQLSKEVYGRK